MENNNDKIAKIEPYFFVCKDHFIEWNKDVYCEQILW